MSRLTFKIKRTPGFRFNLIDLLLILSLSALSLLLFFVFPYGGLYLLPLYVGATFFLFCNVFRIGNSLEPYWYVIFLVAAAAGIIFSDRPWFWILVVCEPVKVVLILYSLIRPGYRGAGYEFVAGLKKSAGKKEWT